MTKRLFLVVLVTMLLPICLYASEVAITMDDPSVGDVAFLSAKAKDAKIREALRRAKVKVALFVCGMRVDNPKGKELLQNWDHDGHLIGNHSYSHRNFNSPETSLEFFSKDFEKGEKVISSLKQFEKLF